MKVIFKSCVALFAILLMVSCAKTATDKNNMVEETPNLVHISFEIAGSDELKSYLGENGKDIIWEASDGVAVYDGYGLRRFNVSVDEAKITIWGDAAETAENLYMVHPYDAYVGIDGDNIKVSIPNEQIIPAGKNIDPKALVQVSVAKIDDNITYFKNAFSVMEFDLGDDDVKSVTFRGKGGEKFCGDVNVNVSNIDNVTVDCADQMSVVVAPAEGTFAQGTYYAAIAPKAFTGGIEVITRTTADLRVLETESELTFARKGGKNLGSVATNAKTVVLPFAIKTEPELTNFAKYDRFYDEEDEVTIENDINLDAASWEPFTLRCSLDGKNHTIDNVKVAKADTAAFISKLEIDAVLKNIKIGSQSTITVSGEAQNSFAGVIGYARRGTIDNVTNCAVVSSENGTSRTNLHMGGVLGKTESKTIITNCTNKGAVTSNSTVSGQCYLGGIAGYLINYTVTFENCTNTAAITNMGTVDTNLRIGGMVGSFYFDNADRTLIIKDCWNSGKISNNSETLKEIRVGGILGSVTGASVKVDGCRNTEVVASTVVNVTGGSTNTCLGGIIGYAAGKNTSVVGCVCDIPLKTSSGKDNNGIDLTGNSQKSFIWAAGGFIGYSVSNTQKIESCKFSAVMRVRSKSGSAAYKWGGATVGRISNGIIINNTLVRGKVTTTDITAENWNQKCVKDSAYTPFFGYDDGADSPEFSCITGTGNGYWSSYPAL